MNHDFCQYPQAVIELDVFNAVIVFVTFITLIPVRHSASCESFIDCELLEANKYSDLTVEPRL